MISRKRMGIHIADIHPEEVLFDKNELPPELIDIKD